MSSYLSSEKWARALVVLVMGGSGLLLASCGKGQAFAPLTCPKGEKAVWISTSPRLKGISAAKRHVLENKDNDAGKGRIPDAIADPDVDQSQRRQACVSLTTSQLSPAGSDSSRG